MTLPINSALEIEGFTVLQVKATPQCRTSRCLYVKAHVGTKKCVQWPEEKTIIVYNVPPYCKEENLKFLFQECGEIARVYIQSKPSAIPEKAALFTEPDPVKGVQVAYVVFKNKKSVVEACCLSYDETRVLSSKEVPLYLGLSRYIQEYVNSAVKVDKLEEDAEAYMKKYYQQKDKEEKKAKAAEGVADEDGFITVTRYSKNSGRKRTEETEKKALEYRNKKRLKNELQDFYSFQFRETKRKHISDLQAKFEEDKKRVQQMKAMRKFKPY